jgi:preprotein translocase subunit SecF
MRFIKQKTDIKFISLRYWAFAISAALILVGVASLILKGGPNYGIDFAGGTLLQVKFVNPLSIDQIREALNELDLGDSLIQQFGERKDNEVLIRVEKSTSDLEGLSNKISQKLGSVFTPEGFEVRRVEMVGPQVGKDLRQKGILAILYALLGILLYIAWRFELKFAVGAILALFHDIIITVGIFSVLDKEFTLAIVAALLTIAGYSINDTIVVFDRFRENLRSMRRQNYEHIMDLSINETLSRTILTSLTTLLVTVFLLILGGGVIHDFALALTIGIVVGTYSSVFIASPIVFIWNELAQKREKRSSILAAKTAALSKQNPNSASKTSQTRKKRKG